MLFLSSCIFEVIYGGFGGLFRSQAAATPHQSGSSSFGFAQILPPQTNVGTSNAASDTGAVGPVAGQGIACAEGVNASTGSCAQANHP